MVYHDLLKEVSKALKLGEPFGVSSSKEMETVITEQKFLAGVRFFGSEVNISANTVFFAISLNQKKEDHLYVFLFRQNITTLPMRLSYSLRFPSELRSGCCGPLYINWHTDKVYPVRDSYRDRWEFSYDGDIPNYNFEGFLPIQNAIAAAYIRLNAKQEMPEIWMKVS